MLTNYKKTILIGFTLALIVGLIPTSSRASSAALKKLAIRAYTDGFFDVATRQFEQYAKLVTNFNAEVALKLGHSYYEIGNYSNSLAILSAVNTANSSSNECAVALYWSGKSYESKANLPQALFQYENAYTSGSTNIYAKLAALKATKIYLSRQESHKSLSIITNFFKLPNDSIWSGEIYFLLSQAYLAEDQPKLAIALLNQGIDHNTNSNDIPFLNCAKAIAQLRCNQTNAAFNLFHQLEEPWMPASIRIIANYYLALNNLSNGQTNRCSKMLETIVESKFKSSSQDKRFIFGREKFPISNAALILGQIAAQVGDYKSSQKHYAKCLQKYRNYPTIAPRALLGLCSANLHLGYINIATQGFYRLTSCPIPIVKIGAFSQLATLAKKGKKYDLAIGFYQNVANIITNTLIKQDTLFEIAKCNYYKLDYPKANILFAALATNQPSPELAPSIILWQAWSHLKMKENKQAAQLFEQFLVDFPQNENCQQVILQIARIHYQASRYDLATGLYLNLITNKLQTSWSELAAYELGWLFISQNEKEKAIQQFSQFAALYPNSELCDDIYYYLGEIYFNMKIYERAQSMLLTIIKKTPNSPFVGPSAYWAALSAFRMSNLTQSESILDQNWAAINKSSYRYEALLLKGDCMAGQKRNLSALKQYLLVANSATASYVAIEAKFKTGATYLSMSNIVAAIKQYSSLTEDLFAANRARAHMGLGKAYLKSGQRQDAISEWLKIIYDYHSQTTIFNEAIRLAAKTYEAMDLPDRAAQIYRISVEVTSRKKSKDKELINE